MKFWGKIAFIGLVFYFAVGSPKAIREAFAQASAGYTKISTAPVSGLTFTDSTVVDGALYQYQVTAVNQFGESAPATSGVATVPATGTHSATLSWVASTTAGVTYNVYRIQGAVSNPPGAVSVTVN
jgi:hypothetical protein